MNVVCGIYKIESKTKPNRIYIGSAVNFKNRKNVHIHLLRTKRHENKKLQNHYNKYGEDDLVFSLIAMCKRDELIPINNIIRPEQFFIWAYDPWFNICKIAGSPMGRSYSEEVRAKISNTLKGNTPWNKGLTKETNISLKNISESMKGNKNSIGNIMSDDNKRKASERMMGEGSPNFKGRCSWNKGKNGLQTAWNKGKQTYPKIQEMLRGLGEKCKVSVLQYDKKGVFIKEWDSFARIQRDLKISASNVVQCAKGRVRSAGGYVWKYKDIV